MAEMLAQSKLKKVQSNLKVVVEMGSSEEQTDAFWILALIWNLILLSKIFENNNQEAG